jgi:hypothetical protein
LVSSQSIPQAPGANEPEHARGLSVGPLGDVNIFDGTASPSLATLSAATNNWSFQTLSGWSTVNNITYGGVAAYKSYIFASDMGSANGQNYGLVRFDSSGGQAVAFAPGTSSIQITLGLDGLLYELVSNGSAPATNPTIQVFNPDTLALVRTFTIHSGSTSSIHSIAVDSSGNVYAADWFGTVTKYDSNGNPTGASITLNAPAGYAENLISIALDTDGQIAVGGRGGEIFLTNESLSSAQTIQTNQWNVFVTFDHYIGGAQQMLTPSFSMLAGPTIIYGQSSVTLGGQIAAGSSIPPGSVTITVAGMTQSAAIDPTNGTFSSVFNTSTLGVSGSPYTITYSYPGGGNFSAITDTSKSLTVTPAVTTLNNLSSPTIVFGTNTATLSGKVGSNSVLPVGQSVTVTVVGANGSVANGSGVIASDGSFQVTLNTADLPAGAYTIQYQYAGDANFAASSGTGTLQVGYGIQVPGPRRMPVHAGAVLPIKLEVTDAAGMVVPSSSLTVTAVSLVGPGGVVYTPHASGMMNPHNAFRHIGSGYGYNLDTTGLPLGTYTLLVQVGNDPVLHAISFVVVRPTGMHGHHHMGRHRSHHSHHHSLGMH